MKKSNELLAVEYLNWLFDSIKINGVDTKSQIKKLAALLESKEII